MQEALQTNDIEKISRLIKTSDPVNKVMFLPGGITPFEFACKNSTEEVITFLLDNGADPNLKIKMV